MIKKRNAHESFLGSPHNTVIHLTDHNKGDGQLRLEGVGPSWYVQDHVSPGSPSWYYNRGHYEWDQYKVIGRASPEYEMCFGLRVGEDGHVRPSSVKTATIFKTKEEASEMVEKWLADGGPSLALEHPNETAARARIERSAYSYSKIVRLLSGLTDDDLRKLSESSLKQIAKREENAAKELLKAEAKRLKAEEKARLAAEKEAKKKAAVEAKALKDAEKARKQAEREAKQAAAAAKKAAKEAKNEPLAASA